MVRGVTSAELLEDTTAASIGEANEGNVQAALDAANTAIGERATTAALASSSGGEMVGLANGTVDQALLWTVTPQQFGAMGDGVADDTAELLTMFASGARRFDMGRDRTYRVNIGEGNFLGKFIGGQVEIFGENVKILDLTSDYTVSGAFTQVFWAQGTTRFSSVGINYEGPAIASPGTNLGYIGASFVRATHGATNTHVEAYIENAQHGVHSGAYNDVAYGGCNGFTGKITAKMVGYPIAAYLADNVFIDVEVDGFHRAAYLAGVQHSGGIIRCRNQYVAPIALLFTDAKTGVGTSIACAFAKWQITDTGSTTWVANGWLAGISPSRADAMEYHDIEVSGYVVASDTVAATMGLFGILSTGPFTFESYPFNWEQTMALRRIKVGGLVDRSAQTVTEHSIGEIYISTKDSTDHGAGNNGSHYATCEAIDLRGFKYIPGSGTKPRPFSIFMPGLVGTSNWEQVDFGTGISATCAIETNATSTIAMKGVTIQNTYPGFASDTSKFDLDGCNIAQPTQPTTNKTFNSNSRIGGAGVSARRLSTELSLTSGTSVNWANSLPNNSVILGITGRITEAVTGPTSVLVGIGTDTDRFCTALAAALGSTFGPGNSAADIVGPLYQKGTGTIVVTSGGGNFTGGKIRLVVEYLQFSLPTA